MNANEVLIHTLSPTFSHSGANSHHYTSIRYDEECYVLPVTSPEPILGIQHYLDCYTFSTKYLTAIPINNLQMICYLKKNDFVIMVN